jgi:sialate O-acetylesterase
MAQGKSVTEMPALFSDNMVLQQKAQAPCWGKAKPNDKVFVNGSWGAKAKAVAKSDGSWNTKIKTPKAGGPYKLTIKTSDTTITYTNVLIGEVWLCSGQSNMEMPLEGWPPANFITNSVNEIKDSKNPQIHLFNVTRAISAKPEFQCIGKWSECSPEAASGFSATAYFFGKKLQNELHVPIGLIVSCWGGTMIQSWTNAKYLETIPEYKDVSLKLKSVDLELSAQNTWIRNHPIVDFKDVPAEQKWENLEFGDAACSKSDFNDQQWKTMKLPTTWEAAEIGDFDGVVWFRKTIKIPASWLHQDIVLELGPIDDMDRTFINGISVGRTEQPGYWQQPRIYKVSKDIVNQETLTIAVRVLDNGGGGGLWGDGKKMQIRTVDSSGSVDISGDWKYLASAEFADNRFYVYDVDKAEFNARPKLSTNVGANTPTMLYNAMVAPLVSYAIKGAIWYQGEANSDTPLEYRSYSKLLPLLIKNWRADWKEGNFSFYYAQIAPFGYGELSKSYMVRDAERLTLSVPKTGMAVLLDIGDSLNIHPPDKLDVGNRLALWALAGDYHKKIVYSGPLYKSMKIVKNKIALSFYHAEKKLVLKSGHGAPTFEIAGSDKHFVPAEVTVRGTKLIVSAPGIEKPVAVRYGWRNFVVGNLFNESGLPASSFRTDNWEE